MDKGAFPKLQSYHVIFLVQNIMAGEGILALPHLMSGVGYNEWWVPFVLGIIAQLTLFPMYWLCIRYPQKNLFEMSEILLGKVLGKAINLIFILYALTTISSICQSYIRLVQSVTLTEETIVFPLLCLLAIMVYITNGGIKSIARFCMLAFFFTVWMVVYLKWGFTKGELSHIFPLVTTTFPNLLDAVDNSYSAMLGYELILVYFPYIVNQKKALKHASLGLWISVGIYFLVTFVSVIYFSEWQLKQLIYPVLNLYKAVELSFVERIENFGISLWVFLILSTAAAYLWMAKKGVDSVVTKKRTWHLYLCAAFSYAIILALTSTKIERTVYDEWSVSAGYAMILYPILLLGVHALRRNRERQP
ncbi:GerAB/ArcD/ProY family transporter [Brevibacillus fluminis]|uniref:GerAB/ArcD/ProY family transporter n=1 Tax=Brevibacillus fluminis TaxID=511487 RepID=UPI003F8A82C8